MSSKLGVIGCGWYPLIIVNTKSVTQLVMMILVVSLNTRVPLISIGVDCPDHSDSMKERLSSDYHFHSITSVLFASFAFDAAIVANFPFGAFPFQSVPIRSGFRCQLGARLPLSFQSTDLSTLSTIHPLEPVSKCNPMDHNPSTTAQFKIV